MICSMTGYGRGEAGNDERTFVVEIRSVNHRYCEISVKAPRELNQVEESIKNIIREKIGRGKVDVFIKLESKVEGAGAVKVSFNKAIAAQYAQGLRKLGRELGISGKLRLSELAMMPDVIAVEKNQEDAEKLFSEVKKAINTALNGLIIFRQNEGARLTEDLLTKCGELSADLSSIEKTAPSVPENYYRQLRERIKTYLEGIETDEGRIAQEVAIFAERCCIDEEIVRLKGHLAHFTDELKKGGRVGRKLDFMTQEINREINTIGSKANELEIAKLAVNMKSVLEQIREQVQNIE